MAALPKYELDYADVVRSPGGMVGEMHAGLTARLTADEYRAWLLPPQTPGSFETGINIVSVGSGIIGMALGIVGVLYVLS